MALFFQGLWPSTIGIDDLQLLSFSADTVLCFSSISGHRNSMQKYLLTIWQHLITPPIYPSTLNLNRSSCLFLRDFNSNRLWSKLVQLANSKHDSFQTTLEQMSIHSCCPLLIIKTTNILIMMVLVCEAVLVFGEIEIGHWALFAKIATSPLCPNETDSKDPLKVHQRTRRLMAIPAPSGLITTKVLNGCAQGRFHVMYDLNWLVSFLWPWHDCHVQTRHQRAQQERIKLGDWNGLAYGRSIILRYTPIPCFSLLQASDLILTNPSIFWCSRWNPPHWFKSCKGQRRPLHIRPSKMAWNIMKPTLAWYGLVN